MADPGQIAWFVPFPDVIRRGGLPTQDQGFFGSSPQFTIPSFDYFEALSEPVRIKIGLRIGDYQDFWPGFAPILNAVPNFGYFQAFSEPVRFRAALRTGDNQDFWPGLVPIPLTAPSFDYYQNLSNPIWLKRILMDEIPSLFTNELPITTFTVMCPIVNVLTWTADITVADTIWSKEDEPI